MRDIRHSKRQRLPSASSAYHRDLASWLPHAVATLLILVTFVVFWQVHSYEFVLWDEGRFAEAKQHFSEVLRLDPNHAAARRFLAGGVPPGNSTLGASNPDTRP